jgi:hypothetical protein
LRNKGQPKGPGVGGDFVPARRLEQNVALEEFPTVVCFNRDQGLFRSIDEPSASLVDQKEDGGANDMKESAGNHQPKVVRLVKTRDRGRRERRHNDDVKIKGC